MPETFDAVLLNFFIKRINSHKYMPVAKTKVRFEKNIWKSAFGRAKLCEILSQ